MHSKLSSDDVAYGKMPSWYAPVSNAKFVIYVTQTLLGDGFMVNLVVEINPHSIDEKSQVYRLYIVWGRRWPAWVVPGIFLICDASWSLPNGKLRSKPDVFPVLGYSLPWLPMIPTPDFFVMSFFTNVICTGMYSDASLLCRHSLSVMTVLIIWRVLRLTYGPHSDSVLRKVIESIVQSAAVYSTASIALVITVLESPTVGYVICLNAFPALIVSQRELKFVCLPI